MNDALLITMIAVTAVLLFFEFRRSIALWSWFRGLLIVLSVSSLYFIRRPPSYSIEAKSTSLIWTNEFEEDLPDSMLQGDYRQVRSFEEYANTSKRFNLSSIKLIGEGLPASQRAAIEEPVEFYPIVKQAGITAIRSDELPVANRSFGLDLSVRSADSLTLTASTDFGLVDSAQVASGESSHRFELKIPVDGYHLIDLIGCRENDTIFHEQYPLQIRPEREPKFLLLGSSPTFEQRYLLNFLQQEGISVDVRQQLSPDLFRTQFINSSTRPLDRISSKLIDEYQVLLIDPQAYVSLSSTLQSTIDRRLKSGQMGLVLLEADENTNLTKYGLKISRASEKSLNPDFPDQRFTVYEAASGAPQSSIRLDEQELAVSIKTGIGSISLPLVDDSYRLVLQGDSTTYRRYWSTVLDAVVGYQYEDDFLYTSTLNFENSRMDVLTYGKPNTSALPDQVLLTENTYRPGFFKMSLWPDTAGWMNIPGKTGKVYVQPENSWKAMRADKTAMETIEWLRLRSPDTSRSKQIDRKIPAWIFFLIFLLSAGGLWLDEKIRG
jgi:hypothetical protein